MVRILILVVKTEVVKNKEKRKKLLGWQGKKRNKINV